MKIILLAFVLLLVACSSQAEPERYPEAYPCGWQQALLGADFVQSRMSGDTLREYVLLIENGRAYELFSTYEPFDYHAPGYETWLFISEYRDGVYEYLNSFKVFMRQGNATEGISLVDVDFDGAYDVLVWLGHFGNQGLLAYEAFLNRGDTYVRSNFIDIPNPDIDHANNRIRGFGRGSAASHSFFVYEFIDGEFVMTNELIRDVCSETLRGRYIVNGHIYWMDSDAAHIEATIYAQDNIWGFSPVIPPHLDIHWDNGVVQYGSRAYGNNRVLYAVENDTLTQLAVFPPLNVEWGHAETEWCRPQCIFYFDVVDDWIILSAGEFQGSGHFFYGGIFRVARDGSGREQFPFGYDNHRFIIINGWIYHNDWDIQGGGEGWIRIRPDGTDKEILDENIHSIYFLAEDGYIYGAHATGEMINGWSPVINFVRWQQDSDSAEYITLFPGAIAPICEDSGFMVFWNIEIADDYILFTVFIWGHRPDDMRDILLYTADYRVDKDGSNLTLLNERWY